MRCAVIRRACGDTERARDTSTTPPSAARSARGARANNPIASPCLVMRAHPSLLFSPPGHGFSTLGARWRLLIGQYTREIVGGDTVGLWIKVAWGQF